MKTSQLKTHVRVTETHSFSQSVSRTWVSCWWEQYRVTNLAIHWTIWWSVMAVNLDYLHQRVATNIISSAGLDWQISFTEKLEVNHLDKEITGYTVPRSLLESHMWVAWRYLSLSDKISNVVFGPTFTMFTEYLHFCWLIEYQHHIWDRLALKCYIFNINLNNF